MWLYTHYHKDEVYWLVMVLQVSASDADEAGSRYAQLTYSLQDDFDVFNIDERTGVLICYFFVIKKLRCTIINGCTYVVNI